MTCDQLSYPYVSLSVIILMSTLIKIELMDFLHAPAYPHLCCGLLFLFVRGGAGRAREGGVENMYHHMSIFSL